MACFSSSSSMANLLLFVSVVAVSASSSSSLRGARELAVAKGGAAAKPLVVRAEKGRPNKKQGSNSKGGGGGGAAKKAAGQDKGGKMSAAKNNTDKKGTNKKKKTTTKKAVHSSSSDNDDYLTSGKPHLNTATISQEDVDNMSLEEVLSTLDSLGVGIDASELTQEEIDVMNEHEIQEEDEYLGCQCPCDLPDGVMNGVLIHTHDLAKTVTETLGDNYELQSHVLCVDDKLSLELVMKERGTCDEECLLEQDKDGKATGEGDNYYGDDKGDGQ